MSHHQFRRSTSSESQPTRDRHVNESVEPNGSQPSEAVQFIPLDRIVSAQYQPRQYFDEDTMQRLTASVTEHGILQPLLVRPVGDKYELVAGERRYKAATEAGLTEVPALVRKLANEEAMQYALVENLQREDLNSIEEVEGIL
jgi:ParB family transcriptional regulator, chromosome partitioning protein